MYAISEKPGVAYTNYFQDFRGNFSVTLTSCHIRYASLSNLNDAVPICDSVGQRTVNEGRLTLNERLRKPLISWA
jgi:hypothetical protein